MKPVLVERRRINNVDEIEVIRKELKESVGDHRLVWYHSRIRVCWKRLRHSDVHDVIRMLHISCIRRYGETRNLAVRDFSELVVPGYCRRAVVRPRISNEWPVNIIRRHGCEDGSRSK